MSAKRYSITIRGWEPAMFEAETAGKAKYHAYLQFKDAGGHRWSFEDFLHNISVLHFGPANPLPTGERDE